ncbi:hypothetical protein R5H32_11830 [Defluviimonas sp. D31]|uniref:hypothetical protein n=1 Tax=Defluviimonas sp. D31 TaxID=3083253 RepID=UPI00296F6813|nr:hypothetical protein [Defluviimonas sp. D31]MDW4550041.1 hypothetical protein [Defluviimonas sp. D31]
MKKLLSLAVLACAFGTAGMAQTYAEKLYENGSLTLNNTEQYLKDLLLDHGVSEECLGKLSWADASEMQMIIDGSDNREGKKTQIKLILDKRCK